MRIVFLSDTHNYAIQSVPDGDMVVHAGDATGQGTLPEIGQFLEWYGDLPHKHKVFVAGNHDWLFQTSHNLAWQMCLDRSIYYLEDSGKIVDGLHLYGSPWQPVFCDWAFNAYDEDLEERFQHIPGGLDLLITHGPPYGILDESAYDFKIKNIGSKVLLDHVKRAKPRVHVFGHAHGNPGQKQIGDTLFINAAICNPKYVPINEPIYIDLPRRK